MTFTVVDYVVIGIVLIAAFIGLAKGFIKLLFTLCKGVVSFLGAYLLCKPLTNIALGMSFSTTINEKILEWVSNKGEVFTLPLTEGAGDLVSEHLGLPGFISKYIADILNDAFQSLSGSGITLGQAVADTLTYYVLIVLCFIVLLIVIGILVKILSKIFTKIFDSTILRPINKLLGFVLGAALGVIGICLVFILVNALGTFVPPISDFITAQINPSLEEFGVARWLYNNNVINWFLENLVNAENIQWTDVTTGS